MILNEVIIFRTCRTLGEPIFSNGFIFIIHERKNPLNGVESIFIFFYFLRSINIQSFQYQNHN